MGPGHSWVVKSLVAKCAICRHGQFCLDPCGFGRLVGKVGYFALEMLFDHVESQWLLGKEVVFGGDKQVRQFANNLLGQEILMDVKLLWNPDLQPNRCHVGQVQVQIIVEGQEFLHCKRGCIGYNPPR
jgi:hypothetical protein